MCNNIGEKFIPVFLPQVLQNKYTKIFLSDLTFYDNPIIKLHQLQIDQGTEKDWK